MKRLLLVSLSCICAITFASAQTGKHIPKAKQSSTTTAHNQMIRAKKAVLRQRSSVTPSLPSTTTNREGSAVMSTRQK